MTECRRKVQ